MPLDDVLLECEEQMEKAVEHLRHEMRAIRTGRATPALVEHLQVDYYGSPTALKSIAAITVPEATQLLIKPFSPQDVKAVEKAISDSKLGLSPHSDGKQIRLMLPPLSQERRLQLATQAKQHAEHAKIGVRNARRDANKTLETEQKAGGMSEDELERGKEEVQNLTKAYEGKIDELTESKRKEIMEV